MDYDQNSIELANKQEAEETQFIFVIDGWGSMAGKQWNEQLESLRNILVDLSASPNNHISIVVFDSKAEVYCEDREAAAINVNAIRFPGAGTSASAAFHQANLIMSRYLRQMNLYFVYISDGQASHPAAEIQEMLRIKTTCTENGETFRYASILIGEGEGKRSMELINQELKGTS